jgi:hypothetical protein
MKTLVIGSMHSCYNEMMDLIKKTYLFPGGIDAAVGSPAGLFIFKMEIFQPNQL